VRRHHPGAGNKPRQRPTEGNRLLFTVPLTEHLYSAYFRKWLDLNINPYNVITIGGIYPADAMNEALRIALERRDWDAFVSLEHDHEFPVDLVERMAAYPAEADIVGIPYTTRNITEPRVMTGSWAPEPHKPYGLRYLKPSEVISMCVDEPGLYPIDFVPLGCTFIRRRVFEEWDRARLPVFQVIAKGPLDDGAGHDVRFCKLAQEQGFRIYLDAGRFAGHIASMTIGLEWYLERLKLAHYERLVAELRERGILADIPVLGAG